MATPTYKSEMFLQLFAKGYDRYIVWYGDDGDGGEIRDFGGLGSRGRGHGWHRRRFAFQSTQNASAQKVH